MIVDVNVLIYATDDQSRFHQVAKTWLEQAFNEPPRVGLPWPSLLAFQRIMTNPRACASPLTPQVAWRQIEVWLARDQAWIPTPGPHHCAILSQLISDTEVRGNLVMDAHLAALAIEYGVGICSFDTDFARFTGLNWFNPNTELDPE